MVDKFDILVDTNNKSKKHPEEIRLQELGHRIIKTGLPVGDYAVSTERYRAICDIRKEEYLFNGKENRTRRKLDAVGTYTIAIDTKLSFQELEKNLLNSKQGNRFRFKKELQIAKNLGVKMIILIVDDDYESFEEMREFFQSYGSGNFCGSAMWDRMAVYRELYGCEFVLCKTDNVAEVIEYHLRQERYLTHHGSMSAV